MFDTSLPTLTRAQANRLIDRVDTIRLFAHAYSFHLNFRFGTFGFADLLAFACDHTLHGIKIHVDDGEEQSLRRATDETLATYRQMAEDKCLEVHLEVSSTEREELAMACRIGSALGVTSIRCYPRYTGQLSEVIRKTVYALKQLEELDPEGRFTFTLEQHEDLKSYELVSIVEIVGNPRLSLMFDFSNMLNAYETPLDALRAMAPHITDTHIKDVKLLEEMGGWGQLGCKSGAGDIPQARLLLELLLLGDDKPQLNCFGLEEEVGVYAPPFRFPNEEIDPHIPYRDASLTELEEGTDVAARLEKEKQDAFDQVRHIRRLLASLRDHAATYSGGLS